MAAKSATLPDADEIRKVVSATSPMAWTRQPWGNAALIEARVGSSVSCFKPFLVMGNSLLQETAEAMIGLRA
jgi:hypothetical protein